MEIGGTTAMEFHCSGSCPAWVHLDPKWSSRGAPKEAISKCDVRKASEVEAEVILCMYPTYLFADPTLIVDWQDFYVFLEINKLLFI